MQNLELHKAISNARLKKFEIAKALGITDSSFSRLLRYELGDEKKMQILDVIEKLKTEAV